LGFGGWVLAVCVLVVCVLAGCVLAVVFWRLCFESFNIKILIYKNTLYIINHIASSSSSGSICC